MKSFRLLQMAVMLWIVKTLSLVLVYVMSPNRDDETELKLVKQTAALLKTERNLADTLKEFIEDETKDDSIIF